MGARRNSLLAICFLSVGYFLPFWMHPQELLYTEGSDFIYAYYPWRYFTVAHFNSDGCIPRWLPICCGQPFQACPQMQLFYPPAVIFYLFPADYLPTLSGLFVWLHVFVAGICMYYYASSRGLADYASLVAAICFMFSAKWLLHVIYFGHHVFLPLAWCPLLLLCVERAIRVRSCRCACAAGLLAAVIFLGSHPQFTVYVGLVSVLITSSLLFSAEVGRHFFSRLKWFGLSWSITVLCAACLSAIQLLPTLEYVPFATRAGLEQIDVGQDAYDLTFHSIGQLGNRFLSLPGGAYVGQGPAECNGVLGLLGMSLSVLAVLFCRRRDCTIFGLLLLFMLMFASNESTPLYPFIKTCIPGFALFRIPSRILLLAGIPLGMLCGAFTQEVLSDARLGKRTLACCALLIVSLLALYSVLALARGHLTGSLAVVLFGCAPALALTLLALSRQYQPGPLVRLVWLACLVGDLGMLHWKHLETRPVEYVFCQTPAVRFLRDHPGFYRVIDEPGSSGFSPITYGLSCVNGIDTLSREENPCDLHSFRNYLSYVAGGDNAGASLSSVFGFDKIVHQKLFDLLAVRYLLRPLDRALSQEEASAWRLVATLAESKSHTPAGLVAFSPYGVYERVSSTPMAFIVSEARELAPRSEIPAQLRDADVRRTVFLDHPSSLFERCAAPVLGAYAGPAHEEAPILEKSPNRMVVGVNRQMPGYLVVSEAWYPGWRCVTSDGHQCPVWRGNAFLQVVPLHPGAYRVEFTYESSSYRIGRAITICSALFLGLLGILSWVRKGRPSCDALTTAKPTCQRSVA